MPDTLCETVFSLHHNRRRGSTRPQHVQEVRSITFTRMLPSPFTHIWYRDQRSSLVQSDLRAAISELRTPNPYYRLQTPNFGLLGFGPLGLPRINTSADPFLDSAPRKTSPVLRPSSPLCNVPSDPLSSPNYPSSPSQLIARPPRPPSQQAQRLQRHQLLNPPTSRTRSTTTTRK